VVYDDTLNSPWSNYPPNGDPAGIQFDQSDISESGNAIKVKLNRWDALDFSRDDIDWEKYQWLEFDMFVEPGNVQKFLTISVTLRDTSYQSSLFTVGLLQSQFITGGELQPGTWQHIRIPLDVFGPLLSHYVTISLSGFSAIQDKPFTLYLDNVVLSGK
jgi:hypothetical protein